ncbi:MAG TPA: exodeoxyribonuclease VII small subunit [Helicobacteraceae bacterium]|nr:exodeoxyribonuclease VII small subunit [Helicobacteraceae bacterium]
MSEKQSFETKIAEAKKVLETLMKPDVELQSSVKAYEKGIKLLKEAQLMLEEAELKIEQSKES